MSWTWANDQRNVFVFYFSSASVTDEVILDLQQQNTYANESHNNKLI